MTKAPGRCFREGLNTAGGSPTCSPTSRNDQTLVLKLQPGKRAVAPIDAGSTVALIFR